MFVARGEGKFLEYALKIDCATSVPIVSPENEVHRAKSVSANKIKCRSEGLRKSTPQESGADAQESSPQMSPQMSPQNISEGAVRVMRMIKEDDRIKVQTISDTLNVSRRTVLRYVKELASVGLHFEGPTKKGRWVFDKQPADKKKGGRK